MIRGMIKGIVGGIKLLFRLAVTLGLIAVCVYIDARYIEPKLLKCEKVTITTDKIKLDQPLKIIQFSDTHLSEYYTLSDLRRLVDKINALEPDLIIFTGDLIDDNKTYTDEEGPTVLLKELTSKYGKFAVIGNHDHGGNGTKRYIRIMKNSGFTLLKDRSTQIILENGSKLSIIGIDDIVLGKPNMNMAFKGVADEGFRIFLSHAPDIADKAAAYHADLGLSGHTHGGQVRIPFIGALLTPPYGKLYIKGLYEVGPQQMQLYVNTGIGMSQLPYRFLDPPTITEISLVNE